MTDSESDQPIERRRADPLQVAADMLANESEPSQEAPSRPSERADERPSSDRSEESHTDDSPRARRAAAKAARQAAIEQRRAERSSAKASAAARRHSNRSDDSAEESRNKTLAEKLEEARGAVATPPDSPEVAQPQDEPARPAEWGAGTAPTAA